MITDSGRHPWRSTAHAARPARPEPGPGHSCRPLIDELWQTAAPQRPDNALQLVVFKLRRALGADRSRPVRPDTCWCVPEENVDAHRFERLVRRVGRDAHPGRPRRPSTASTRRSAFGGAMRSPSSATCRAAVSAAGRFEELQAATVEERFDALLAMGRDADLVPDLDAAIAAMPFRERLRGQLMLALYRSGRQADALRAFRDARQVLAEELGLEPGAELRRLEAAILGQDEALECPPRRGRTARPAAAATPTNLRPALSSFVGRERRHRRRSASCSTITGW